jgi:hypothetical protein
MNRIPAIGFGKLLNAVKAEDLADFPVIAENHIKLRKMHRK